MGMLRWTVTLGRFDIACGVMSLSKYCVLEPREGHLALARNIFGYPRKYPDGVIRFRTGSQIMRRHSRQSSEWEKTGVYGDIVEELPPNEKRSTSSGSLCWLV